MSERDTHFQGFAKLLWEEASNTPMNEIEQLIARRAYDLVVHALNTCSLEAFEIMGNGVEEVPDLAEWPKSEQRAMMDFHCGVCNEDTRATAPASLGKNTMAITCSRCGKIWHIIYEVLSLDPFTAGGWEIKRMLGILRDGKFYAKEDMQ